MRVLKKYRLFLLIIPFCLVLLIISLTFINNKESKKILKDNKIEDVSNSNNKKEKVKQEIPKEEKTNVLEENPSSINNEETKQESNINEEQKDKQQNSNIKPTTPSEEKKNEPVIEKQEPIIQNPQTDLSKEVDPNGFSYSIHHGVIEFNTNNGCMLAGDDIAFIDVVDIRYVRCHDVMSKANTIMGYYLEIFCESGNCNKYKNNIDLSKYD